MKYKGYEIISRPHPTPCNSKKRGYDIEYAGVRKMTNVSTIDMSQHVIDVMLERGLWKDAQVINPRKGETE